MMPPDSCKCTGRSASPTRAKNLICDNSLKINVPGDLLFMQHSCSHRTTLMLSCKSKEQQRSCGTDSRDDADLIPLPNIGNEDSNPPFASPRPLAAWKLLVLVLSGHTAGSNLYAKI